MWLNVVAMLGILGYFVYRAFRIEKIDGVGLTFDIESGQTASVHVDARTRLSVKASSESSFSISDGEGAHDSREFMNTSHILEAELAPGEWGLSRGALVNIEVAGPHHIYVAISNGQVNKLGEILMGVIFDLILVFILLLSR